MTWRALSACPYLLELFYDSYVDRIVATVSAGVKDEPPPPPGTLGDALGDASVGVGAGVGGAVPAWTLVKTIELLCFCAQHHSFRIKYYVLRNNVAGGVLRTSTRPTLYLLPNLLLLRLASV